MSRSFFTTGNDAELYTGSAAFSQRISATPEAFGLTPEIASSYAALDAIFAAAYLKAASPETRTTGTVAAKNTARDALKLQAAAIAKRINGNDVSDQQRLGLGLNVPKAPSPLAPPGKPTDFSVALLADGSIELTFKCSNPRGASGTLYQVSRRTTADGAFTYLGGVGVKKFTDATLPAGTPAVTYLVQAVRSKAVGASATFNVRFGTITAAAAPAAPPASVSQAKASPKLAA